MARLPLNPGGADGAVMLAAIFHTVLGDFAGLGLIAVLGALAAFVAWGRLDRAPIASRGR